MTKKKEQTKQTNKQDNNQQQDRTNKHIIHNRK